VPIGESGPWHKGQRILCKYGGNIAKSPYYEAVITEAVMDSNDSIHFFIHYPSWGTQHDEVVSEECAWVRFMEIEELKGVSESICLGIYCVSRE